MVRWSYLQYRNRDTDIENERVDTEGEGESRTNEESTIDIYTLPCVKKIYKAIILQLKKINKYF